MDISRSLLRVSGAVGAIASAAWVLPIALIQIPAAAADPCPDVEVVFARGTTEPPGVGGTGQAFVDSLRSQLGGRSVGVYAVDYPASRDFDTSTPAGAGDASSHIQSMAANCPNTRLVLGGYSQGAGVIDLSTTAMPPQIAGHVAAAALFGAPRSAFADTLSPGPLPDDRPALRGQNHRFVCAERSDLLQRLGHACARCVCRDRNGQSGSNFRSQSPLVGRKIQVRNGILHGFAGCG